MTELQRINHYRYLVFMGNCNGVIGYGKGKGHKSHNYEEVLSKAIMHCKKKLIVIPFHLGMTFP